MLADLPGVFAKRGGKEDGEMIDFKKFKELTGLNGGAISERFGFTRQYVHQLLHNHSVTYKAAAAYMINIIIDDIILKKKSEIQRLEEFKQEIKAEVGRNTDEN